MDFLSDSSIFQRLILGLYYTLYIALIPIIISIPGGFLFGFLMTSKKFYIKILCRIFLEAVRIIPIIVWLFLVYFGLGNFFELSALASCLIVFSIWGIVEAGDLSRGAITAIPTHQIQSAKALGLNTFQIQVFIIIPQAGLQLIPAFINLFTRMIKTTALVSLIGVMDLLKIGQQIIETGNLVYPNISFWIYGLIFFIYFFICYFLSLLSSFVERKLDYRKH